GECHHPRRLSFPQCILVARAAADSDRRRRTSPVSEPHAPTLFYGGVISLNPGTADRGPLSTASRAYRQSEQCVSPEHLLSGTWPQVGGGISHFDPGAHAALWYGISFNAYGRRYLSIRCSDRPTCEPAYAGRLLPHYSLADVSGCAIQPALRHCLPRA